jgi:hypothetical protein
MKATRKVCGDALVWDDANLQRVSVAAFWGYLNPQ